MRESDEQNKMTKEKLGEDRKWVLDATIVRLMKSRRTMEHREILIEVINMLRTTFTPAPDDMKKRIESLIERGYLERDEEVASRYIYKA